MQASEALDRILKSYVRYYDINRETPKEPFAAEAEFHSTEKGYVFSRKAVISEAESNEYLFFYTCESITGEDVERLSLMAWEEGLGRVQPHRGHRNSDVTVIIVADRFEAGVTEIIKKLKYYKSYKGMFNGWSTFRIVGLETSTGQLIYNRRGSELKKIYKGTAEKCKTS